MAAKNPGEAFPLVSRKLIDLIECHADELTRLYLDEVKSNPQLSSYRKIDQDELYKRAYQVYHHLGKWISKETTKEEVRAYWWDLGKERRGEGLPLSEIILSLCILRALLWKKVEVEGMMETALDLYEAMELNNRVIVFFDRAVYYASCGFEDKA
ncbi:MAG: hypothetical protein A2Y69_13735 [Candidatus Aminicenantes bacterium RBG_13_59_9]|nr:MAG: hypothetical protein A2Y69_13735 [Candidatus Aminicenantes bacterium RBG_13_59_9]